jgi:hypothetical protein
MKQLRYREVFVGDGNKTMLEEDLPNGYTRIFARTVAAVGWPSDKPGGFVVVAETLTSHPFPTELVVVDVFESPDLQEILNHAVEAQVALKYKESFADVSNGPMRRFLVQYNDIARGHKRREVSLRQPQFWEEDARISHYLQCCKTMLQTGDKHLHLESHQRIAAALGDISYDRLQELKEADTPMLAALGYVVAFLQANPFQIEKPSRKDKGMWAILDNEKYDPLGKDDKTMAWNPFSDTDPVFNYNPK